MDFEAMIENQATENHQVFVTNKTSQPKFNFVDCIKAIKILRQTFPTVEKIAIVCSQVAIREIKAQFLEFSPFGKDWWFLKGEISDLLGAKFYYCFNQHEADKLSVSLMQQGCNLIFIGIDAPNTAHSLGFISGHWDCFKLSDQRGSINDLSTHGWVTSPWIPPKSNSRFVTYDASDEHWLRPFGLGTVRPMRQVELYDVRDEIGNLIGYSQYSPSDFGRKAGSQPCFQSESGRTFATIDRIEKCGFVFRGWTVNRDQIPRHASSKLISVWTQDDQIEKFIEDLSTRPIRIAFANIIYGKSPLSDASASWKQLAGSQ
jgi:hypothetical protein